MPTAAVTRVLRDRFTRADVVLALPVVLGIVLGRTDDIPLAGRLLFRRPGLVHLRGQGVAED